MDNSKQRFIDTVDDKIIYRAICCYNSDGEIDWEDVGRKTCESIKDEIEKILNINILTIQKMRPVDVFRKINVKINHLFILFESKFSNEHYDYIKEYKNIFHAAIRVESHDYVKFPENFTEEMLCEVNEKVHGDRYSYLTYQMINYKSDRYGNIFIVPAWFTPAP